MYTPKLIIAALFLLAVGIALYLLFRRPKEAIAGLRTYLGQRQDYQIYIGLPLDNSTGWAKATRYTRRHVWIDDEAFPSARVSSFLVAYPNGEMLTRQGVVKIWPPGIHGPPHEPVPVYDVLNLAALEFGNRFLEITYEESEAHPGEPGRYSTTIRNISSEPIKVVKFGGYEESQGEYVLHTITDGFFTDEQFRSWYGVSGDGWIEPGDHVCDHNNYGGDDGYWAYFCTTQSGKSFTAGAKIPNSR